ncbi:MAG: hypothetical protein ACOH14_10760 [Rhodoglobus sp.]
MTDPVPDESSEIPTEAASSPKQPAKPTITPMRIALWVLVAGAGLFMVLTGIVGVLVKAQ